jgi:hypothetical protein
LLRFEKLVYFYGEKGPLSINGFLGAKMTLQVQRTEIFVAKAASVVFKVQRTETENE